MNKQIVLLLMSFMMGISYAQVKVKINDDIEGERFTLKRDWGNLSYEVFGKGDPLLILHGNGGSVKSRYQIIPSLLEDYQIIAVDSRCHGESSCPEGALDYFEMADDVIALMNTLGHNKYSLWGHSDGGILGLIIGYKQTNKIDRMLISGGNTKLSGLEPELVAIMENYEQIPDPKLRKQIALMVNQKEIPMDSIRKINVPVMLVVGDRDAVLMEHTMEIFKALPMSNLCVIPASSHFIDPKHIVKRIKEFRRPFTAPSTVKIATEMAKSMLKHN
ncbi:alpha/beta fold hydrolase [Flavobacteriaceae bacterium R38]|nr:alpha/beta fold hydrolase [Flavobacteriaceae bacterium R38]